VHELAHQAVGDVVGGESVGIHAQQSFAWCQRLIAARLRGRPLDLAQVVASNQEVEFLVVHVLTLRPGSLVTAPIGSKRRC
jgi:hypothetical protein